MTAPFPGTDAAPAEVLGARPGADPTEGDEAIHVALQPDGEEPQVFSFSIAAAYHLREALDAALEAPFFWEDDTDGGVDLGAIGHGLDPLHDLEVIDLASVRTVRWDETWARSHPR